MNLIAMLTCMFSQPEKHSGNKSLAVFHRDSYCWFFVTLLLLLPVLSRCCLLLDEYIMCIYPQKSKKIRCCVSSHWTFFLCPSRPSHQTMLSHRKFPKCNHKQIAFQRWDNKTENRRGHEKMFFLFFQGI